MTPLNWPMKLKSFFLLLIPAFLVIGCQKDPDGLINTPYKKTSSNPWSEAANPANPYENLNIGLYHNRGIEYFRYRYSGYPNENDWKDDRHQIVIDFFCSGTDTTFCDPGIFATDLMHLDSLALNDSLFQELISVLPPKTSTYIDSLEKKYDDFTRHQYTLFKNEVVELENQIINDSTLSPASKKVLLISCQVARYSALYWKNQIDNNFYSWNLTNWQNVSWSATSKVDMRGAIAGFISTGMGDSNKSLSLSVKGATSGSVTKATKPNAVW